jgi:hypothetical protein
MTAGNSQRWVAIFVGALLVPCGGCSNGDFGRVKAGLVADDIHAWVGTTAAAGAAVPASLYPLTDSERLLRDLAYPLIEPPYDRQRWYSFLNEYGIGRVFQRDWAAFDERAYAGVLISQPVRSPAARYARLDDDIRNDRTRIPPFFMLAARVLDMDRRRAQSVPANARESDEARNASARNAENALVVSWVQWSLKRRAVSYRYALQQLVVAAPMEAAEDTGRYLAALQQAIESFRILPGPDLAPDAGAVASVPNGPSPSAARTSALRTRALPIQSANLDPQ